MHTLCFQAWSQFEKPLLHAKGLSEVQKSSIDPYYTHYLFAQESELEHSSLFSHPSPADFYFQHLSMEQQKPESQSWFAWHTPPFSTPLHLISPASAQHFSLKHWKSYSQICPGSFPSNTLKGSPMHLFNLPLHLCPLGHFFRCTVPGSSNSALKQTSIPSILLSGQHLKIGH